MRIESYSAARIELLLFSFLDAVLVVVLFFYHRRHICVFYSSLDLVISILLRSLSNFVAYPSWLLGALLSFAGVHQAAWC